MRYIVLVNTMHPAHLAYFDNWTTQARKGMLELCILNLLAGGERYGYDLAKLLASLPGSGVSEGTIYPLLSRLRVQGLVATRLEESSSGPARKYYRLTPGGQATVALMNDYWALLNRGMSESASRPIEEHESR